MIEIQNIIEIKAPFNTVFDMTNDIRNWPNLFTEYKNAEILFKENNYIIFELTTYPDEEGKVWTWISERFIYKDEKRIVAKRIYPLSPFQEMTIEWKYLDNGDATEMLWIQKFEIDPQVALSENTIRDYLNKTSKEQMQAIKKNIEKILK